MRTLNVRRLLVVLVTVLVVAGSAHLLHSYQVQRKSLTFKTHAESLWKDVPREESGAIKHDTESARACMEAVRLMSAYIALEPHDNDAIEKVGCWLLECGRPGLAAGIFEELLRTLEAKNPPDLPTIQRVRREVVEAAMKQGRCLDAVSHLKILREQLPDDVDVLDQLGKCLVALGQEEEAINSFSAAIKLRPDWVDVYVRKAAILRGSHVDRAAQADRCMEEMLAYWEKPGRAKNKLAYAHHVYGLWLSDLGRHAEALKQAEAALAIRKDQAGTLFLAAQSEMALRHFPKAEQYARRAVEIAPQNPQMYALLADVCQFRNDQPEVAVRDRQGKAIEVLKHGTQACPSDDAKAELDWRLANLYLDRSSEGARNIADAEDCMKRMRDRQAWPARLAFLEARVAYCNEDWKTAREGFEKVRPRFNDAPQLLKFLNYWVGYCYRQQSYPEKAMSAFHNALGCDKTFFKAYDGLAQVLIDNGEFRQAVAEYGQAAVRDPGNVDAWLALARALVIWNLHRGSFEQNWDAVEQALGRARELSPRDARIILLDVEVLHALGRTQAANDLLKMLREESPDGIDFWMAQIDLAARERQADKVRKTLAEAKAKLGDRVPLRLAQAAILLNEQHLQAGAEIEKLAANTEAFSNAEKTQLWSGLMTRLQEINDLDRAQRLCRQVARLQPHDAMIRYRLFELTLRTHNAQDPAASLAELDGVLEEIDKIAGQGPLWLYCKAVRLWLAASSEKPALWTAAMDFAAQAQKLRPTWSRPYVLQGGICRQQGRDEDALQFYLQASLTGDRDPDFIRVLLRMLYDRQLYKEAEVVIRQLDSTQTALSPEAGREEAQIFSRWGAFDRALEVAKTSYDPNSDDYRDHLWFAQVLTPLIRRARLEGHQDKLPEIKRLGEEALRRACRVAPNTPDCRVALVQWLVDTDQMHEAEKAASDAEEMIPPNVAPLALGYIYEALGKTPKAQQSYEKALKLRPDLASVVRLLADFYVRSQQAQRAAPLIEKLLSGELKTGENDLVSARRLKAGILFKQGYPKLKEAVALLDLNLASRLASPVDKRMKVRFLLTDPRRARSLEVLEVAEGLVNIGKAEPDPEDRFQLAQLYLTRGNWDRCRDQMTKLVDGDRPERRYLVAFIRLLLDHDEVSDAKEWLDRIDRNVPTVDSIKFRAEVMFRNREWSKLPDFLADYVSQPGGEPKDPLDRTLAAARLLEDFGSRLSDPRKRELAQLLFDHARADYESYARQRPGGQMYLAGFHARYGKVDEAIARIDRYGGKAAPEEVFDVVNAIVSRPATAEQLKKLEPIVAALADKMLRPAPVLVGLAEVQAVLNRPADAEKIYREILAKDPDSALAGNNLSMLLALQRTKLGEALDLIDKVIERTGPLGPFLDTRAVVLIVRHEPRLALDDLELALAEKVAPTRIFHKAWAYLEDGNLAQANELLRSAKAQGLQDSMLSDPERKIREQIENVDN